MVYFCWPGTVPKHQAIPAHSEQTDTDSPHPTTQSDLDSQTARPQARNTASGCSAARSLHRSTGFAVGTADARSCKPAHPFSDDPRRCILRTIRDYRGCRSSRAGCRLGRCGNRRCIVCRLWRCQRFAPAVRSCLGRYRYRCSCLCRCTPAISGCRPRRSGCVSGRYSSKLVCLGVLWKAFCRTGRRRMSRFRYCRRAF